MTEQVNSTVRSVPVDDIAPPSRELLGGFEDRLVEACESEGIDVSSTPDYHHHDNVEIREMVGGEVEVIASWEVRVGEDHLAVDTYSHTIDRKQITSSKQEQLVKEFRDGLREELNRSPLCYSCENGKFWNNTEGVWYCPWCDR